MNKPIALAGIGKIARDEHVPALAASGDWTLDATISRNAETEGARAFATMEEFLADPGEARSVSLALPPGPRFAYAMAALGAGMNVMLEKPPGRTLSECRRLEAEAERRGVTLFASWHSRVGAAVAEARRRLREAPLRRLTIDWREDVRRFHPGQDWVFEAGNLGVFDPGINAMSILVDILSEMPHPSECTLRVPEGREGPIAADLRLDHPGGAEITARLDWRHEGDPVWDMHVETEAGDFTLSRSGSALVEGGRERDPGGPVDEYPLVYERFSELVEAGRSEVDLRPLELVADAFLIGRRERVAAFDW